MALAQRHTSQPVSSVVLVRQVSLVDFLSAVALLGPEPIFHEGKVTVHHLQHAHLLTQGRLLHGGGHAIGVTVRRVVDLPVRQTRYQCISSGRAIEINELLLLMRPPSSSAVRVTMSLR